MQKTEYYNGQLVFAHELTHSQTGLINNIKNRVSDLYTDGVVEGLTLMTGYGSWDGKVIVLPGIAYDSTGERIVVSSVDSVQYSGGFSDATYAITARYTEGNDGVYGIDPDGTTHLEHVTDSYSLQALKIGTDSVPATDISLGQAVVSGGVISVTTTDKEWLSLNGACNIVTHNVFCDGMTITGDLIVTGDVTANEATLNGITLTNDLYTNGLTVIGTATIVNEVVDTLQVNDSSTFDGLITSTDGITLLDGGLGVIGNTVITGNLNVGGTFTPGVQAKVGVFVNPSGTGNYSVTGIGFSPKLVEFIVVPTASSTTTCFVSSGRMDQFGEQHAFAGISVESGGSASGFVTNRCYLLRDENLVVILSASFVSMDSGGFTVNVQNGNNSYSILWKAIG